MLLGVLGANLWATMVLVPALWAGTGLSRLFALVPLVPLLAAVLRPRDLLLFGAFPAALLVCALAQPEATALLGRAPALILATFALVAYLFAAARAAARAEAAALPETAHTPLLATPRRAPPGRILFAFALIGPAVLLFAAVLRPGAAADLAAHHADRPAAGALVLGGAAALWAGLIVVYIRSALPATGEQKRLRAEQWALRAIMRRGRPGPLFYAAVTCALVGMAALVYLRYR